MAAATRSLRFAIERGRPTPDEARSAIERALLSLIRPSEVLAHHRDEIRAVLGAAGIQDVRVFGSTARGEDAPGSDLDLLVVPTPGSAVVNSDIKYLRDMILHIGDADEIIRAGEDAFLDTSSTILFRAAKSVLVDISSAADLLSEDLKSATPHVPWRTITRTRSKLAHHYDGIQRTVVWETLVQDLPALRTQLEGVLQELEAPTGGTAWRAGSS